MEERLELILFGNLEIRLGGVLVTDFKSLKAQALLCYLAVTGRPHNRSTLAGLLWGDMPEKNARMNLSQASSTLRRFFGDFVDITRQSIALKHNRDIWADVTAFETGATGDPKAVDIHTLQEAVQLYRGDLLDNFPLHEASEFDTWVMTERARLRRIALDSFQTLVSWFMERKEYDSGISYARRLLIIEPWHEEAHRDLMYMLASSGQRSAAIKQFEKCRKLLNDELEVDPSPSTVELFEKIRQGELDPGPALDDFGEIGSIKLPPPSLLRKSPMRDLPSLANPLIGRQPELQELINHLTNPDVRLVTIAGIGGIGKTQLALSAAHHLVTSKGFRDGVFFVPLSPVTTRSHMLSMISEHIGLTLAGARDSEVVLLDFLRDKSVLMVLDNFEQLLPEIDFLARLLQALPLCKLLITSRERLKLREEWVLDLEGLTYPEAIEAAQNSDYGAILLFSERARQIRSSFSLEDEIRGVVRICRMTQGLPLALEQAAGLVRVSSAEEIANQVEERLDALSTSLRNLPERHRSMRAIFDEIWCRLSEAEQLVFCRLSVFQGGFAREAAQQVADANLNILTSLVDKSLIRVETHSGISTRYTLHNLVWQYADEKLLESGQSRFRQLRMKHLNFYLSLAERARQSSDTEQEWEWLERLETERGNLHFALRWAIEQKEVEYALQLNADVWFFWLYNSPAGEAIDLLESSLSMEWDEHSRTTAWVRARVLILTGYVALLVSDFKLAERRFQEGAELFSNLGDQRNVAWSLRGSSLVCLIRGDLVQAQNFAQESWDICRETQHEYALAWAAFTLGSVAVARDELEKAESLLYVALTHFRQNGRVRGMFHTLISLGQLKRSQGNMSKAMTFYKEALSIQQKTQYIHYVAQILEGLAHIAIADNNPETAVQLFGAAQARRDKIEMARWAHHEIEYQQSLALTRNQLPATDWQAAWERGYRMSYQHGLAFARAV